MVALWVLERLTFDPKVWVSSRRTEADCFTLEGWGTCEPFNGLWLQQRRSGEKRADGNMESSSTQISLVTRPIGECISCLVKVILQLA